MAAALGASSKSSLKSLKYNSGSCGQLNSYTPLMAQKFVELFLIQIFFLNEILIRSSMVDSFSVILN